MPTVKVEQPDGEIVIRRNGEPTTYKVSNNETKVSDADLEHFLAHVDGSSVVTKSKPKE